MQKLTERIGQLEAKLKALKGQQQRIAARARAAAAARARKQDTRRKFLVGSFVLHKLQQEGVPIPELVFNGKRFADWLIRPTDRAAFVELGIDIHPAPPASPVAEALTPTVLSVVDDAPPPGKRPRLRRRPAKGKKKGARARPRLNA